MTSRTSFGPLRHPAFSWYLASRTVNLLGLTAASVAMAFAVLDLGGSATTLGQVLAARTVPMVVVVLLLGGVLADRFDRSLVLQASNLTSALAQGATAVLLITGRADLWMILLLQAVARPGRAASPARRRAARGLAGPHRHRRAQPGHPARRHGRVGVGRPRRCRHLVARGPAPPPGAPALPRPPPSRPSAAPRRPRRSPGCVRAGGSSGEPRGSGWSSRGSVC